MEEACRSRRRMTYGVWNIGLERDFLCPYIQREVGIIEPDPRMTLTVRVHRPLSAFDTAT